MNIGKIMKSFTSDDNVGNYNTLLSINLVSYLNETYDLNLINLNLLEDKYRNYSWFLDKKNKNVYNILISIDNSPIYNVTTNNDLLLKELNKNDYYVIYLNLNKLSRNSFLNINCLYKFSLNSNFGREHYFLRSYSSKKNIVKNLKKRRRIDNYHNTRKRSYSEDFRLKWNGMVSASRVRNYILNDPLLDWLDEYNITSVYDEPKNRVSNSLGLVSHKNFDDFTKYIMKQGIIFENEVYKILKSKFNIVKVAESYESRSNLKFKKTTCDG